MRSGHGSGSRRTEPAEPPGDPAEDPWLLVAELPEPERTLVRGVYQEGYTYEEMAERSGIALGTLKRKLRGALGALREQLRPRPRSDPAAGGD